MFATFAKRTLAAFAIAAAATTTVAATASASTASNTTSPATPHRVSVSIPRQDLVRAGGTSGTIRPDLAGCSWAGDDYTFFCQAETPSYLFILCGDGSEQAWYMPVGLWTVQGYCPWGVYDYATE